MKLNCFYKIENIGMFVFKIGKIGFQLVKFIETDFDQLHK